MASVAIAASVPLTLLPKTTNGKCLDGTPSGFYHLAQNSTKWVIAFDGGGECNSKDSCTSKLNGPLGSSNYFSSSTSFDSAGGWFMDTDVSRNPGFGDWNKVRVAYCTQDLHMGTVTTATAATWGLFFSGELVFQAILDALDATSGLKSATDILLSGESAGGIAVWPKVDALAARYPAARVSGAPVAGFYSYSFPYTGPNATNGGLANFNSTGLDELYALYQPSLNAACVAANAADPAFCILSNNSFPYVKSAMFVTESLSDSVQLTAHDNINAAYRHMPPEMAYISEWQANMSAALTRTVIGPATDAKHGGFAAACWIHTDFAQQPTINGENFLQVAARWYAGTSQYKVMDLCGAPFCNPSCPPSG